MLFLIIVNVYTLETIRIDQSCATGLTGYFWNGQQCIKCKKPSCKCTAAYQCTSCVNNYYYDSNQQDCQPCPLGCVKCCKSSEMTQFVCTLCQENYIMISGVCLYVGVCTQISIHGRCQQCPDTYYLHEECKKCPEGCGTCDSSSYCTSCQDGYYSDIVQTDKVCVSCNGEQFTGCKECKIIPILGVQTLNCLSCIDYYFYDEITSVCKQCPQNCLVCQNPDQFPQVCYECGTEYLLTIDLSGCQSCQEQIINCMTCAKNDKNIAFICVKCDNTYYLSSDGLECIKCNTSTNHVRRCNSEKQITQCEVGYLLLQDASSNFSCIKNLNNCNKISNEQGECSDCLTGYVLTMNLAAQISICENCVETIKNCITCITDSNKQLICQQCQSGYYGDKCAVCTSNCNSCLSQTQCSSCLDGYFLDDQKQCQSCEIDFCVQCTTVKKCTKCQENYGLFNSTCQQCLTGCQQCDSSLNQCQKCADHYYLTVQDQNCKRYKENCLSSNINGYCYLCETVIDYDPATDVFQDESATTESVYNVQPATFYISNNGYCLICSDYSTGTYNCPQICKIESEYSITLQLMIIILILQ